MEATQFEMLGVTKENPSASLCAAGGVQPRALIPPCPARVDLPLRHAVFTAALRARKCPCHLRPSPARPGKLFGRGPLLSPSPRGLAAQPRTFPLRSEVCVFSHRAAPSGTRPVQALVGRPSSGDQCGDMRRPQC